MVSTFVDVLKNVLDGMYISSTFNIDVAVVFSREEGIIGNYPAIVNHNAPDLIALAIVGGCIEWVTIFVHHCMFLKGSWVMFCALPILHAWCMGIEVATRPMNHASLHGFKEQWLAIWVWPLSLNIARTFKSL